MCEPKSSQLSSSLQPHTPLPHFGWTSEPQASSEAPQRPFSVDATYHLSGTHAALQSHLSAALLTVYLRPCLHTAYDRPHNHVCIYVCVGICGYSHLCGCACLWACVCACLIFSTLNPAPFSTSCMFGGIFCARTCAGYQRQQGISHSCWPLALTWRAR